jgi:hypothetical protein
VSCPVEIWFNGRSQQGHYKAVVNKRNHAAQFNTTHVDTKGSLDRDNTRHNPNDGDPDTGGHTRNDGNNGHAGPTSTSSFITPIKIPHRNATTTMQLHDCIHPPVKTLQTRADKSVWIDRITQDVREHLECAMQNTATASENQRLQPGTSPTFYRTVEVDRLVDGPDSNCDGWSLPDGKEVLEISSNGNCCPDSIAHALNINQQQLRNLVFDTRLQLTSGPGCDAYLNKVYVYVGAMNEFNDHERSIDIPNRSVQRQPVQPVTCAMTVTF